MSLSRVPVFSSPVFFLSFMIMYSIAILVAYSFAVSAVGRMIISSRSPCVNLGPFFMAESCAVRTRSAFYLGCPGSLLLLGLFSSCSE